MPYFLVTHTSLVEAGDEAAAAAKVYKTICDSEKLAFDVKADEHIAMKIVPMTVGLASVAQSPVSACWVSPEQLPDITRSLRRSAEGVGRREQYKLGSLTS
jgi:hypothetical protein